MFYVDNYEEKISHYVENRGFKYCNIPKIIGIGIGRKEYDNYRTSIPCLTFLVSNKLSPHEIPTKYLLPKTIGSIMTDVIETGEFSTNAGKNNFIKPDSILDKVRPAYGGLSCSNVYAEEKCEGCIGYAVTGTTDSSHISILSCNHVLTRDYKGYAGDNISQPAASYRNSEHIARLTYAPSLIPKSGKVLLNPGAEFNEINAGVAQVGINNKTTRKTLLDVGIGPKKIILDGTTIPKFGKEMWKMGPSPMLTQSFGKLTTEKTILFSFKLGSGPGEFMFSDQYIADITYSQGDAGAIIVRQHKALGGIIKKNYAVGMCIGGSESSHGKYTVFTPIDKILSKLSIKFLE